MYLSQSIPISKKQIEEFLLEDGFDETTNKIPQLVKKVCSFKFISKEKQNFILCGSTILNTILRSLNSEGFEINNLKYDGETIKYGETILEGKAKASDFLLAERISLNLMQQLSAVSSNTDKMIKALKNDKIKILDTRKTIPGLRNMQKYAVKCGAGFNHRFGLNDLIMIKDNHIKAAGGIKNAIQSVLQLNDKKLKIEVECENISQVKEAIKHKIDFIMLDNMSIEDIKECSKIIRTTNIKIEVSGGINLQNIHMFSDLDIDFISSGAITHSIESIDISAKIII